MLTGARIFPDEVSIAVTIKITNTPLEKFVTKRMLPDNASPVGLNDPVRAAIAAPVVALYSPTVLVPPGSPT
jgi:hypothetical protein